MKRCTIVVIPRRVHALFVGRWSFISLSDVYTLLWFKTLRFLLLLVFHIFKCENFNFYIISTKLLKNIYFLRNGIICRECVWAGIVLTTKFLKNKIVSILYFMIFFLRFIVFFYLLYEAYSNPTAFYTYLSTKIAIFV